MRSLSFTPTNQALPKMGILTQVLELTRYDYIYLQNRLHNGIKLSLIEDKSRIWDPSAIAVYYKGYKLGYLGQNINKIIKKILEQDTSLDIKVRSFDKINRKGFHDLDILISIHE